MFKRKIQSITIPKVQLFVSLTLACLFFSVFSGTANASAGASYGWVHPVAELIGEDDSCGPSMSVVDVALKEHDSQTSINPAGVTLRVRVVERGSGFVVEERIASGQSLSDKLCFNVSDHALLVNVSGGNYHEAGGVALSLGNDSQRFALVGRHFRAKVHLLPQSNPVPNIEHLSPLLTGGGTPNLSTDEPSFRIRTNSITSQYESNQVIRTTFYVRSSGGSVQTRQIATVGPAGSIFDLEELNLNLNDGFYTWYLHQRLDGFSRLNISGSQFDFTGLPESSLSESSSLRVDVTAPEIHSFGINGPTVKTKDKETLNLRARARDTGSGLASTTITVRQQGSTEILFTRNCMYSGTTNWQNCDLNGVELEGGEAYVFTAYVEDLAGNIRVQVREHTVRITPTLGNLSHTIESNTSATFRADLIAEGSGTVSDTGFCYARSIAELNNSAVATCVPSGNTDIGPFELLVDGLPTNTIIYYRAYGDNLDGRGFTDHGQFPLGTPNPVISTPATSCVSASSRISFNYSALPALGAFTVPGYDLEYCQGSVGTCTDGDYVPLLTNSTETGFIHVDLDYNQNYTYRVRALNPDGVTTSDWVYSSTIQSRDCSPGVGNLTLTTNCTASTSRIRITYSSSGDNADSYDLRYCVGSDPCDDAEYEILLDEVDTINFWHTNLVFGETYQYQVRSRNAEGVSAWSAPFLAIALDCRPIPSLTDWDARCENTQAQIVFVFNATNEPSETELLSCIGEGECVNPPSPSSIFSTPAVPDSFTHNVDSGQSYRYYLLASGNGLTSGLVNVLNVEAPNCDPYEPVLSAPTYNDTDLTAGTARIGGNITDNGRVPILRRGTCWSEVESEATTTRNCLDESMGADLRLGSFDHFRFDLPTVGSVIYYVAYAENSAGIGFSEVRSHVVGSVVPQLGQATVSNLTFNPDTNRGEAMLGGVIVDDGGASITRYGTVYCTSSGCTPNINSNRSEYNLTALNIGDNFAQLRGNLPPGLIRFSVFAENSAGVAFSAVRPFNIDPNLPTADVDIGVATATISSFTADRILVRFDEQVQISWEVDGDPSACSISGQLDGRPNPFNLFTNTGEEITTPLGGQRVYTLQCAIGVEDDDTTPIYDTREITINVVPRFLET